MSDLYETLGVPRNATPEQIKKAYRALARQHHPDANPADSVSEERFREIAQAYEVLSDPERRAHYDRFGSTDGQGPGLGDMFGGGLGDLFDAFFGGGGGRQQQRRGPQRGPDIEADITITLENAVFGGEFDVTARTAAPCDTCEATGSASKSPAGLCQQCGGSGQQQVVRNSILGQMVSTSPCPVCQATGRMVTDPCSDCGGDGRVVGEHTYTIDLPAGVDTGSTLRLSGRGAVGVRGGPAGDLYVHVRVKNHDRFARDGANLALLISVSPIEAALGCERTIELLDGTEVLTIPRGTQPGWVHAFRGRGVPRLDSRSRGDVLVTVQVAIPKSIPDAEAELWYELARQRGEEVLAPPSGIRAKLKSVFKT